MVDRRSRVQGVLDAVDVVRGFLGGLLLVVVTVAAIRAGGTAGWALGAGLLVFVAAALVRVLRGLRRP
jgi:hypothetical protein